MSNQASLFGAVKVNGYNLAPLANFFQDVSPQNIVSVELTTVKNPQGNTVPAFKIVYNNQIGLTQDTYYLPTHNNLTTLANFKTALAALGSNPFTIYTNLIKTSDWAQSLVPASYSVMLNDALCKRQYIQTKNQTLVTVHMSNRLMNTLYYFTGDQTTAGAYYYLYSWGA